MKPYVSKFASKDFRRSHSFRDYFREKNILEFTEKAEKVAESANPGIESSADIITEAHQPKITYEFAKACKKSALDAYKVMVARKDPKKPLGKKNNFKNYRQV